MFGAATGECGAGEVGEWGGAEPHEVNSSGHGSGPRVGGLRSGTRIWAPRSNGWGGERFTQESKLVASVVHWEREDLARSRDGASRGRWRLGCGWVRVGMGEGEGRTGVFEHGRAGAWGRKTREPSLVHADQPPSSEWGC